MSALRGDMKPPAFIFYGNLMQNKMPLPKHGVYLDNKVFFLVLTLFSIFPLKPNDNGYIEFTWKSWRAIYTALYSGLGCVFAIYCLNTMVRTIVLEAFLFQELAFYLNLTCFPVMTVLPIMVFARAKRIANYFNSWSKFTERFQLITGKNIPTFKSSAWIIVAMISVLSSVLFFATTFKGANVLFKSHNMDLIVHNALLILEVWGTFTILLAGCLLLLFSHSCKVMSTALLNDVIAKAIMTKCSDPKWIDNHLSLWFNLRHLCVNFGNVFWIVYAYISTWMFTIALPMIYTSASRLHLGEIVQFLLSTIPILCVIFFAEIANSAAEWVGNVTEQVLSDAIMNNPVNIPLTKFVKTVASCPVRVNLGGFLILDRALIVSILSSLITYLIILTQFQN